MRKIRILESIFCKTRTDLIRVQDFVYKTLQLVKSSVLISAITKSFVFFLGKVTNFIFTLKGLEELSTVMYTLDFVSGLHNCLKFSHRRSRLYQAMQTRKTFSIA